MASTDTEISSQATVERLGVETVAPRKITQLRPNQSPSMAAAPKAPDTSSSKLAVYEAIASVIAASAAILATRVILLLALIGAFILAVIAEADRSFISVSVLIAYSVLVVIPLIVLEARTKWGGG